ncbi:Cytochrome c551 [Tritonibacter multivorans]|uniref:Cytochrome c551 n=1 Tax=Tritonibacter multivorans TaxID=928856 RepID=A0A0P1GET4_9RHOB|nr:c-type cytochrome [Tritonibacter multivorans]MDA7420228.1 cytochrome C [Tritonibacter multivorans]CUH79944.1 Cytochrome c551 [Tritonibacter multivorans]SFB99176.1 cytochrome c [Tritonibacter multivorans]
MKHLLTIAALGLFAAPAFAEGDTAKGEKAFNKCKSCHMIVADNGDVIKKGGKTGPNLWGVAGRTAGTVDGFRYGKDLVAAGEAGLVWDEASFVAYTADPKKFLKEQLDSTKAKSKMSFKLKKGGEDIYAYLLENGPAPATDAAVEEETTDADAVSN